MRAALTLRCVAILASRRPSRRVAMASSPPGADPTDGLDPPGGGSAVAQVTSGLRRAGTQVKRFGRKILGTAGQALPLPLGNRSGAPLFPDDGPSSPPRVSSAHMDDDGVPTPGGKSRYGRLDPRRLRPTPYADHPTPPEGYVNVWVDNFRRWQKRWLVATTPGVLIFHRRSTKIGPSTSVDLTVANVVVSDAPGAHPRQFLVVTGDAIHRVRALHVSARQPWVDCIKNSALKFEHARQLVRSRSLARAMPPRPSARASNGSASVSGSASGSVAALAQGVDRHASPSGVSPSNQTLDPELRRHKLREAFFRPLEPARRSVALRAEEAREGEKGWAEKIGLVGPGDPTAADESATSALASASREMERTFEMALEGAIVRCASAEAECDRLRAQVARLSAALAEFTGLGGGGEYAPSRSPATTPPAVAPPSIFHEDTSGQGHARAQGQNALGKTSVSPVVVTPGESSAFTRALLEKEEDASSSSSEDDSDEYGSVASFVTTGSSFRAAGSAHGGDDADEYIAAMEVINKHDYFVSAHAAATGVTPRASEDGDRDRGAVGDDDGSDSDEEAVSEASADDWADDDAAFVPRARLPAPQPVNQSFSLWDILKQSMGKDLSRISMPANINQPLSTLQRMTEDFEYLHLLYDAVDGGSGINRMTALVGFVASSYASWYGRQQKPFAPTLGETYDWTSPDGRVRVVCEQVIYADPPACAFRATGTTPGGRRFVVDGEGAGISKFWGKYVQIVVQGGLHMELPDTGETFSWSKASMHVHNVISGRIWIDMVGEVTVLAHKTGESAKFRLLKGKRPEPGKPDVRGKIDGEVYDAAGNRVAHVQGNVLGKVWARPDPTYVPPPGGEALHERFRVGEGDDSAEAATSTGGFATPIFEFGGVAPDAARQYGFTRFAITLNELSPEMLRNLPPTDSRFRPDMRALEDGHPETASKEKVRVEDRNRALAAARKRAGGRHQPAWFEKRAPTPGGQTWGKHVNFLEHQCALWVYKGGYWEQRASGEWTSPPVTTDERFDIFDLDAQYQSTRKERRRRSGAA